MLLEVVAQADADATSSAVDTAVEWVGVVGLVIGLLLGAAKLGAMIIAKHAAELEERRAHRRFGLYFPDEGEESPLSVPAALEAGGRRMAAIERDVGSIKSDVGALKTAFAEHTSREDDLSTKLEEVLDRFRPDEENGEQS